MYKYDRIIIGAGLYGLYSANYLGKSGYEVLVLECDDAAFARATYVNQARVHMGYHYPRSYSTAIKSAGYFERFLKDYSFCILTEFEKIYATSANFSWTNAEEFIRFCRNVGIKCDEVNPNKYFKPGMCDGAFSTLEYTYDAQILKAYMLSELEKMKNVEILYNVRIEEISKDGAFFYISTEDRKVYQTDFLVNATYASTNEISKMVNYETFKIKYELCEIIICEVNDILQEVGITVMDGPFFSIMPFGKTGYHSLTSVTFTPHLTSFNELPVFGCQERSGGYCSSQRLGNCNICEAKPESAWVYMSSMARKYLKPEYEFRYRESLFSMKPILKASEIDDSRPTVIRRYSENPTYISVLSGKINTVYDLDEVLNVNQ